MNICTIIGFFCFLFTNEQTKKRKNGSKIAFFRFLYLKGKNRKTEVELLFSFFVQDQKKEKTEVELLFLFTVHGEKKLMKRK